MKINFIENDLLKGIDKKYDVIISNPPYISYDEKISELVYKNEPHSALFAENNGMYFYEEIVKKTSDEDKLRVPLPQSEIFQ